ncbi:sacsin N-terminal ATP-binding-like domain-containing protein [Vibrio owensii]|uniref:sacsin N-terminal ATP-binding-like domain-containing protein n=1 Tax=Vibrio owensii TaxID=696485 RepID=UPI0040685BCF
MNKFIEELIKDREEYAYWLERKPALRRIVEDLYPDKAHFIYELLQNAEDASAKTVSFSLSKEQLTCSHDGRPFNDQDISAITDIGESSKKDDDNSIGRFGIGFKAVFVYTESPRVKSGNLDFTIERFVVPTFRNPCNHDAVTVFEFPFNSKKKTPQESYKEIGHALKQLSGSALLFLRNIRKVEWFVDGEFLGSIKREEFSDNHISITQKSDSDSMPVVVNWLRYITLFGEKETLFSSIAFKLREKPKKTNNTDSEKATLAERFVVEGIKRGTVSAFFPAEKETSGLRFHVHAPFVTELSRASVKDTPENDRLYDYLADTIEKALHEVKSIGLLDRNFLEAMPNSSDPVSKKYQVIRDRVKKSLMNEELVPTLEGSFKKGKLLHLTKSTIARAINTLDFANLTRNSIDSVGWSIISNQKNDRLYKLLMDAGVSEWAKDDLIECFEYYKPKSYSFEEKATKQELANFDEWILRKSSQWLRGLYSLFASELRDELSYPVSSLRIIPTNNSQVKAPSECYFPLEDSITDDSISCLRSDLLEPLEGESKKVHDGVNSFFSGTGVKTYGEKESILAILKTHYSSDRISLDFETHALHMKKFFSWYKQAKFAANELKKHSIILDSNFDYVKPNRTYLDDPYRSTGMAIALGAKGVSTVHAINNMYLQLGIELNELNGFFEFLGVIKSLDIIETSCLSNPKWSYLRTAPGNATHTGVNRDYTIDGLERLLKARDKAVSELILKTVSNQGRFKDTATFSQNQSNSARYADSQWICLLRDRAWVPTKSGTFVKPCDAQKKDLSGDFLRALGTDWADKIKFCQKEEESSKESLVKKEAAKRLGITSQTDFQLLDLISSGSISEAQKQQLIASVTSSTHNFSQQLPQQSSSNSAARAMAVSKAAEQAPEKRKEVRERSVAVGKPSVRQEAEAYLKSQYSINETMICQLCQEELPFRKLNGDYYFEIVDFIESDSMHFQNHLCLCPNHAAMFKHSNSDKTILFDKLYTTENRSISLQLNGIETELYFTDNHMNDVKAIFGVTPVAVETSIEPQSSMVEEVNCVIDGVVIPKHLSLWRNAFITTSNNSGLVKIGTNKEVVASFESVIAAENWWTGYLKRRGFEGKLKVRNENEALLAKQTSKPVLVTKPSNSPRATHKPNLVRKSASIKASKKVVNIPEGKKYCPKCKGVEKPTPCRECYGTGWV